MSGLQSKGEFETLVTYAHLVRFSVTVILDVLPVVCSYSFPVQSTGMWTERSFSLFALKKPPLLSDLMILARCFIRSETQVSLNSFCL